MAVYQTYQSIGNREDLTDMIYNISPTDTPFMSSIGKTKATAVNHEWQTDSLAAATIVNHAVEGADATSATLAPTTRIGNRTQIVQKTIQIAGTEETIDKAGRKSEKAYQLAKASSELKRDMEKILLCNQAAANGDATNPRKLGSLQAWLSTNTSVGAGAGVTGSGGTTARVDGTDRAFTEPLLKAAVKAAYTQGGTPTVLMVPPTQKQVVSGFAGIAEQRYQAPSNAPTTIIGAADVYLSDFGTLSVVPNRFTTADADGGEQAFVLDPEFAAVAFLRPFQTNELARTGDSDKTQLLAEFTLEVKNEAAHALIADLAE
tara:strand:- start:497 stop:1450 length:954 start_codon:yes stop_codon:yes gene_type:complete